MFMCSFYYYLMILKSTFFRWTNTATNTTCYKLKYLKQPLPCWSKWKAKLIDKGSWWFQIWDKDEECPTFDKPSTTKFASRSIWKKETNIEEELRILISRSILLLFQGAASITTIIILIMSIKVFESHLQLGHGENLWKLPFEDHLAKL